MDLLARTTPKETFMRTTSAELRIWSASNLLVPPRNIRVTTACVDILPFGQPEWKREKTSWPASMSPPHRPAGLHEG